MFLTFLYLVGVPFLLQGLNDAICDSLKLLKWKKPSKIQREAIPVALQGKDVIGLAETGSGKTGAFALPILQSLMETPQTIFALILTPTRELADQIGDQFKALGENRLIPSLSLISPANDMMHTTYD